MFELDLPHSYNMSYTFNVGDFSPFDIDFKNLWSNSLQERKCDGSLTTHDTI